jgi:outer membrane immunogenic protein
MGILAAPAFAADASGITGEFAPSADLPPWTGFYAGLNAGANWSSSMDLDVKTRNLASGPSNANLETAVLLSGSDASDTSGFLGGVQLGYNHELDMGGSGSRLVLGIEADLQGLAQSGGETNSQDTATSDGPTPPDDIIQPVYLTSEQQSQTDLEFFGTVRGRLGFLASPGLLLFGTGGLAYGKVNTSLENDQTWTQPSCGCNYIISGQGSSSDTQVGWTVGGGLEWAFRPNWSLKAEYLYYDLGKVEGSVLNTYTGIDTATGDSGEQSVSDYSVHVTGSILRAGINYHF